MTELEKEFVKSWDELEAFYREQRIEHSEALARLLQRLAAEPID